MLPKSWSVPACQPGRKVTSRQTPLSHPDITINTKNTFYGGYKAKGRNPSPQPWTEQHAGCGQQGRGIHLPSKFLDFKVADEKTTTSGRRRYYKDTWELRRKGTVLFIINFHNCDFIKYTIFLVIIQIVNYIMDHFRKAINI